MRTDLHEGKTTWFVIMTALVAVSITTYLKACTPCIPGSRPPAVAHAGVKCIIRPSARGCDWTPTRFQISNVVAFHLQASGGLMFGYDNGVSGGVSNMDPFLRKFYPSVLAKKLADNNASPYCKVCTTQPRLISDPASMLRLQSYTIAALLCDITWGGCKLLTSCVC